MLPKRANLTQQTHHQFAFDLQAQLRLFGLRLYATQLRAAYFATYESSLEKTPLNSKADCLANNVFYKKELIIKEQTRVVTLVCLDYNHR